MNRKDIEIMAPAGSYESLMAAIQGGADSVYFGAGEMNMRSASSINFTTADLNKIAGICRDNGVKSYLTLNVVVFDDEVEQMKREVRRIDERAFIIAADVKEVLGEGFSKD